jgi:hypothetical protein
MTEHWYWCVDCKTPRCAHREPLRYIGTAPDWPDTPEEIDRRFPLTLQCRACRYTHRYTLHDLRPFKLPDPPSSDFATKI